jgi:Family of unknown function (DUF6529)
LQVAPARYRPVAPIVVAVGTAVAAGIYIFGRNHTPDYTTSLFGQSGTGTLSLKSWIATGILVLAFLQVGSALWIFGKLPRLGAAPRPITIGHRLTGALAILVSIPVAYHCMFAYGVQTTTARQAVHSIAGCLFYGAVVVKIAAVRFKRMPDIALPLAGGGLFTLVAVLWYTSALWKFNNFSLPVL